MATPHGYPHATLLSDEIAAAVSRPTSDLWGLAPLHSHIRLSPDLAVPPRTRRVPHRLRSLSGGVSCSCGELLNVLCGRRITDQPQQALDQNDPSAVYDFALKFARGEQFVDSRAADAYELNCHRDGNGVALADRKGIGRCHRCCPRFTLNRDGIGQPVGAH